MIYNVNVWISIVYILKKIRDWKHHTTRSYWIFFLLFLFRFLYVIELYTSYCHSWWCAFRKKDESLNQLNAVWNYNKMLFIAVIYSNIFLFNSYCARSSSIRFISPSTMLWYYDIYFLVLALLPWYVKVCQS